MDVDKIRKLLDELAVFMKKNDLAELELDVNGTEIKLKKTGSQVQHQIFVPQAPAPTAAAAVGQPAPAPAQHPGEPVQDPGTVTVKSPMVGTFYRSSKPEADHLVNVGDQVSEDTVLCIIEAMKVMNEIKAEHKGCVVNILAENGQPVEYGQPLFQLSVASGQ